MREGREGRREGQISKAEGGREGKQKDGVEADAATHTGPERNTSGESDGLKYPPISGGRATEASVCWTQRKGCK